MKNYTITINEEEFALLICGLINNRIELQRKLEHNEDSTLKDSYRNLYLCDQIDKSQALTERFIKMECDN